MRSLRIGVDVDGTVLDFVRPLVDYLHKRGIMVPSYEDTHSFNLHEVWGCDKKESITRVCDFYASEGFRNLQPLEGVCEVFERLFPPHEAYIITGRPSIVEDITHAFFEKHLGSRQSGSFHLGQFHKTQDGSYGKITKADMAKELALDLFLEDDPVHAIPIAETGTRVLLIDSPWNAKMTNYPLITRVNSWRDIGKYFTRYASSGKL